MAKNQPLRMSTEDFQAFSSKIQKAWSNTPASVTVMEFDRKSELPKWKDCGKDEVFVGIKKRKTGDRLILIRHQTEAELDLKCSVLDLEDKELEFLGAFPKANQHCGECGEFATGMRSVQGKDICCDCLDRRKEREATA